MHRRYSPVAYLFTHSDIFYCDGLKIWFIFLQPGPGEDDHNVWLAGVVHQGRNRGDGTPHGCEDRRRQCKRVGLELLRVSVYGHVESKRVRTLAIRSTRSLLECTPYSSNSLPDPSPIYSTIDCARCTNSAACKSLKEGRSAKTSQCSHQIHLGEFLRMALISLACGVSCQSRNIAEAYTHPERPTSLLFCHPQ